MNGDRGGFGPFNSQEKWFGLHVNDTVKHNAGKGFTLNFAALR
jgi:hypothetical protein